MKVSFISKKHKKIEDIGSPGCGVGSLVLLDTGYYLNAEHGLWGLRAKRAVPSMCMSPGSLESKEVAIQISIVGENNSPPTQTPDPTLEGIPSPNNSNNHNIQPPLQQGVELLFGFRIMKTHDTL